MYSNNFIEYEKLGHWNTKIRTNNQEKTTTTMAAKYQTHRNGVVVGEGETAGDEVLLGLGTLVHDLQDAGLELGDDGNVVGRNAVLSGGTGDDHLGDLGLAVDGLVGEAEVEGHGSVAGLGGSGGHAPGDPAGDGGEGSSEGEHGGCMNLAICDHRRDAGITSRPDSFELITY